MQTSYTYRQVKQPLPRTLAELLPPRLRTAIERQASADHTEEIRLHANREATLTVAGENRPLGITLTAQEMQALLRTMCEGSLYAYGESINRGFLTLSDGIRVGVCGTAAVEGGRVIGVRQISGLMIRIPHRTEASVDRITQMIFGTDTLRGTLIYAPPGVGKTTLLRRVAEEVAAPVHGVRTVVVDTRDELGYGLDDPRLTLDVLIGYPHDLGIEIAVRSLGAELIICDEIGSESEAAAILAASNCGVPLVASAHAKSLPELLRRPAIHALHRAKAFDFYTGLSRQNKRFEFTFTAQAEADNGNGI